MQWRKTVTSIAGAIAAGGCSQSTSPVNLVTGSIGSLVPTIGQSAGREHLSGNLYRVMANDRRLADRTDRENYLLLKSAEATEQVGATHFFVVKSGGDTSALPIQTSPPGSHDSAYIRVMTLGPGAEIPVGAVSAAEIIHFFGPKYSARKA